MRREKEEEEEEEEEKSLDCYNLSEPHFDYSSLLTSKNQQLIPKTIVAKEFVVDDSNNFQEMLIKDSKDLMYKLISSSTTKNNPCEGNWINDICTLTVIKGNCLQRIGRCVKGIYHLLPEEMLYLVQRGNLKVKEFSSLKDAFSAIFPFISLNKLLVYCYLKRLGFAVTRSGWGFTRVSEFDHLTEKISTSCITEEREEDNSYPVVDYFSHLPKVKKKSKSFFKSPDFDVWLPTPNFKKSSPGIPHLRIFVLNSQDELPSLNSSNLSADDCPIKLAVVQSGVISFLSLK